MYVHEEYEDNALWYDSQEPGTSHTLTVARLGRLHASTELDFATRKSRDERTFQITVSPSHPQLPENNANFYLVIEVSEELSRFTKEHLKPMFKGKLVGAVRLTYTLHYGLGLLQFQDGKIWWKMERGVQITPNVGTSSMITGDKTWTTWNFTFLNWCAIKGTFVKYFEGVDGVPSFTLTFAFAALPQFERGQHALTLFSNEKCILGSSERPRTPNSSVKRSTASFESALNASPALTTSMDYSIHPNTAGYPVNLPISQGECGDHFTILQEAMEKNKLLWRDMERQAEIHNVLGLAVSNQLEKINRENGELVQQLQALQQQQQHFTYG